VTAAAAFTPSPHSIAVLPFTNLSGDPKQEYFSNGISEELINALSHIDALQVIARTSSFSFKGQNVDIGTIARRLNVGAVLEGSVRRSGNTIRFTAQLINAVNGFHMWSQNHDRDLKNILALQSEIATAVAEQLRVKLLGNEAAKIDVGGAQNAMLTMPICAACSSRRRRLVMRQHIAPLLQLSIRPLRSIRTLRRRTAVEQSRSWTLDRALMTRLSAKIFVVRRERQRSVESRLRRRAEIYMHVIHFTEGATDPLEGLDAKGVRFVPLAGGSTNTHISCTTSDNP
jgi:TolB-like protein